MELVAPVQWPLHKNRYQKCGKSRWLVWCCLHHPLCTIWSKHEPHATDPDWRAAGVYSCYVSISVCVSGGCHCKFRLLHSQLTTVEWDLNFFQPFIHDSGSCHAGIWNWIYSWVCRKLNLQSVLPETEFWNEHVLTWDFIFCLFAGFTHEGTAITNQGKEEEEEVSHPILLQEEEQGKQRERYLGEREWQTPPADSLAYFPTFDFILHTVHHSLT